MTEPIECSLAQADDLRLWISFTDKHSHDACNQRHHNMTQLVKQLSSSTPPSGLSMASTTQRLYDTIRHAGELLGHGYRLSDKAIARRHRHAKVPFSHSLSVPVIGRGSSTH